MSKAEFLAQLLLPYDSDTIQEATNIYHDKRAKEAEIIWSQHLNQQEEKRRAKNP